MIVLNFKLLGKEYWVFFIKRKPTLKNLYADSDNVWYRSSFKNPIKIKLLVIKKI